MTTQQAQIAMNDQFRSQGPSDSTPGLMFTTAGIAALPPQVQAEIVAKVQAFAAFTEDNDPHGEHDFGLLRATDETRVFWKIDYYADGNLDAGSEDPADAARCFRVLTIMLASEY